jgi:hypothetical protein
VPVAVKAALAPKQMFAGRRGPVRNAPQCSLCGRPSAYPEISRSAGSFSSLRDGENWESLIIAGDVYVRRVSPEADNRARD